MLYLAHFGLHEPPFSITPDTSFFYRCRSIQGALNTLVVALTNGEGFIKITGEVGTGKTLLCRKLLAALDKRWVSAYIPNPNLEPRTLLLALAEELALKIVPGLDEHHLLGTINRALVKHAREGKRVVLLLDEVQAMPLETLEALRLLTNLETEKHKLLQVVLFGQPELDQRLAQPGVRQLRQRITFEHCLGTLTRHETVHYLRHRLDVAGYAGDTVFSSLGVFALHRASRGVPRLTNILANKALMLAYGAGSRRVGWFRARAAARDTPAAMHASVLWSWLVVACIAGSGLGWMVLR
jgi:MSHA biogenesis protein MshM